MRQVSLSHGIVSSTLQSHWAATDMQVVVGTWPKLEPLRCCEETRARDRSLVYQRGCWGTGTSAHSPGCTAFVRPHYISNAVTDNYKQPVAGNRFYGWLTVANRYFAKVKADSFRFYCHPRCCKSLQGESRLRTGHSDFTNPIKQRTSLFIRSFLI